jgi:plastocyanin
MQRRQVLALSSLGFAISILTIFVVPQFSYSIFGAENPINDLLSRSTLTTITITGESSTKIEPDQVSIVLNVQTPPTGMNSTVSKQQENIKKLTDDIISAANLDENSIKFGQTTINPIYSGGGYQQPPTLFNAYSTSQIKTDVDNASALTSNLIDAGYRIENLQVVKVPVKKSESTARIDVSIPSGASTPADNLEYFSPSKITVQPGTTVVWTNNDSAAHTVTSGNPSNSASGLFDSALFGPGKTFEYEFNSLGVQDYFCQVHPWMVGSVTVPEKGDDKNNETKYQINMNVIIETQPASLQETIKNYEEKLETLKKTLESNGMSSDSIKSHQVNFNPIYYGNYGGGQATMFGTYTQIIVKTDYAKVDQVLSAVRSSGANLENIIMSVSDSKIDKIKADLTQQALQNAMENAQSIVGPAGLEIKEIKKIEINAKPISQNGGGPIVYRGVNMWSQYDPSYLRMGEVSMSVTVEFEVGK